MYIYQIKCVYKTYIYIYIYTISIAVDHNQKRCCAVDSQNLVTAAAVDLLRVHCFVVVVAVQPYQLEKMIAYDLVGYRTYLRVKRFDFVTL